MRKARKYIRYFFLGIVGILFLVFVVLNLPFTQRYATRQVNQILHSSEVPIHLDAIRKILPGSVNIQGVVISGHEGDTLILAGELQAKIRLLALIRSKVNLSELELDGAIVELARNSDAQKLNIAEAFQKGRIKDMPASEKVPAKWTITIKKGTLSNIKFRMNDTLSGIHIAQDAADIELESFRVSLPERDIRCRSLFLGDASGMVHLTPRLIPPKNKSRSPWNMGFLKLAMDNVAFTFSKAADSLRVEARCGKGSVRANEFDLVSRIADLKRISFNEGFLAIETGSTHRGSGSKMPTEGKLFPWNIKTEDIEIKNSITRLGSESGTVFSEIDLRTRDLVLDDTQAALRIRKLAFELDNGFSLQNLSLELDSEPDQTELELDVKTSNSRIKIKSSAKAGYSDILSEPDELAEATLELDQSQVSLRDLSYFIPEMDELVFFTALSAYPVSIEGIMNLSGSNFNLTDVSLTQERNINLLLGGDIEYIFPLSDARGELDFHIAELDQKWLEELAAGLGISRQIPELSDLEIHGVISDTLMSPDIQLTLASQSGNIDIGGSVDIRKELFFVAYSVHGLDLGDLLFITDLGSLSAAGEFKGRGFSGNRLRAAYYLQIDTISYRDYKYLNTQLTGKLGQGAYDLQVVANDPFLKADVNLGFRVSDSVFKVETSGILQAQLNALKLYKDTLRIETSIDAFLTRKGEEVESGLRAKGLKFATLDNTALIHALNASFHTDSLVSHFQADADFFHTDLHLRKPLNELDSLGKGYQHYFASFRNASHFTASNRVSLLPEINATAHMSYHNFLDIFLGDSVLRFSNLDASISKQADQNSLRAILTGKDVSYMMVDAVKVEAAVTDSAGVLLFELIADSTSFLSGPEHKWLLNASSSNKSMLTSLSVDDMEDRNVYHVELEGKADSSEIVLEIPSRVLTLNGRQWELEVPDLLSINLTDNAVSPSIQMKHDSSYFHMHTSRQDPVINYTLDLNQVELASLIRTDVFKGNPEGSFNGSIEFNTDRSEKKEIGTELQISDISYSGEKFSKISLDGELAWGLPETYFIDIHARMDSLNMQLRGGKTESGVLNLNGNFTHLPLGLIESYADETLSDLKGSISGEFEILVNEDGELFDGELSFKDAALKVNVLNSAFRIPDQGIVVKDQRAVFNQFTVLDTLDKPLKIDGFIDFGDFKTVVADLNINSSELQVMRRDKKSKAPFTGNIFVDSRVSINGPLTHPDIGGNIHLSEGTEIFYHYMEDLRMTESEKIINFVEDKSHNLENLPPALSGQGQLKSSSIETIIEIDPSTLINFNLAKRMFDIDLHVKGGGNIQYNLENELMALSGRYEIGEGETLLKLVGWPNKSFSLSEGGYIRWDGMVENPELGLEAENKVSTSYVNPIVGKNRNIDFFVILSLSGYLSDLNVLFTIRTPDQYVMSIINTLGPEEQMRQAISVLLFEAIDLPGISSSTDYMTQQVNQILSSQLNQFTKSAIRGVDISFGLSTYDQNPQTGGNESTTSLSYEVRKSLLNNRAQIEVSGRLNDAYQETGSSDHSLNNVSFEYQLDSAASKYLKVYNEHTYDDVFEGEVIKTGIGFSYRKRYKTFRDIWKRRE